ncbi:MULTISPECIES: Uma2 family endonuclease [unclassified Nocardia]|uniref:Uma2 family endonuclease n=1 Tax=unclassified Nocardia TaxID=2637762 RepID=UPI0024A7AD81|nr:MULTISPECIES: Uma2 family endonuclease [unclassified Nocardia]
MSGMLDWAREENLQPEPITVEIWKKLPEDFCRLVEVENGQAVRAESPTRPHQTAQRRLADILDGAVTSHLNRYNGDCLDVNTDFDVLLWEMPRTTIRRPDIAVFDCAPEDLRPLPASLVRLVVEIISPGTENVDLVVKKAEYARAGIAWYWVVTLGDNRVESIEVHVLDHVLGQYRLQWKLQPDGQPTAVELPIGITIDWDRLSGLTR